MAGLHLHGGRSLWSRRWRRYVWVTALWSQRRCTSGSSTRKKSSVAGAGAEKKAHVIAVLRGYTPDWLDWAINERTLDWIVQLVFNFTKKKLEDYMEKKSAETTTVARFGNAGEDKRND